MVVILAVVAMQIYLMEEQSILRPLCVKSKQGHFCRLSFSDDAVWLLLMCTAKYEVDSYLVLDMHSYLCLARFC